MARQSGLGRGLDALLPGAHAMRAAGLGLEEISVDAIEPNPHQPRVHFDEESLADLAASIKEIGILQPILVRPSGGGKYQLIAGERRWRAARSAGLVVVPAVVRETTDSASIEQAIVENLHREDLTPLEEASAYQQLVDEFAYTHEQVARRVGKSRAAITNTLRLMQLPPAIQQLLVDGRLSAGHARALLGSDDRAFQEQVARRAASEGWSVRAVEQAVRERGASGAAKPGDNDVIGTKKSRLRPPGVLEVEELLGDHLATRVSISTAGQRGKLIVEFADLADLDRIYRTMIGAPNQGQT